MSFVIKNGPFKGAAPDASELEVVNRDDGPLTLWGTHARTRTFLEKFPPLEGWAVETKILDPQLTMYDEYTQVDGKGTHQPTREFVATLVSPEGRVIGSASVLKIINSEFAWKAGVTMARAALYEALGLGATAEGLPEAEQDKPKGIKKVSEPVPTAAKARQDDSADMDPEGMDVDALVIPVGESESTFKMPATDVAVATAATDPEDANASAEEASPEQPGNADTAASKDDDPEQITVQAKSEAQVSPARPKPVQARSHREASARTQASKNVKGIPAGLAKRIEKLHKEAGLKVPPYNSVEEASELLNAIMEGKGKQGPVQEQLT